MRRFLAAMTLTQLVGCAAMAPVTALGIASVAGVAGATAGEELNALPKVYGPTEFWFDKGSYGVNAYAVSAEQAELLARAEADKACASNGKVPFVTFSDGFQERALFIPVKLDRFGFELRFRCNEAPG